MENITAELAYFKTYRKASRHMWLVLGNYDNYEITKLHIAFNKVTYNKIQIPAVRKGVSRKYSHAFCLEKRDLNSGVCNYLLSYG